MNGPDLRLSGGTGAIHPVVLYRRIRDLLLVALSALIPAALGLGLTVALPHTSLLLVLAIILAAVGVVVLIVSSRLEITVMLVGLYLGLLDGPIKLGIGRSEATAAARNVLVLAICLGILLRLVARRQRIRLPPLSGWVLAFVAIVLIEAFNPKTAGILKVLAGFRQQAQWVPFFFFGYLLIRSKRRFRQLFLIVGVIAAANGIVASYQTGLSPGQLASWGPGYQALVQPTAVGKKGSVARVYGAGGEAKVRPMGLGSDSGFGGGTGVIALPFCLALFAIWRSNRRWVAAVLALGALVAVATGLGRLQVIGAVLGVFAFAGLASLAGPRVTRALGALFAVAVLAVPLGALFVSIIRSGTFNRYQSIAPEQVSNAPSYKEKAWTKIPGQLASAPFGVGLASVGAANSFGGHNSELLEGHTVSAETQYNFIVDELGAPGLLVWVAMSVAVISLVVRGIRRVRDPDLAVALAGMFAPFIALTIEGFAGPFMTSAFTGPYFWFAIGVAAYWFAGPGRRRSWGVPATPGLAVGDPEPVAL